MPRFSCPICQKSLKLLEEVRAGKKIRCPGCGEIFRYQSEEADELAVAASSLATASSKKRGPASAETPVPAAARKARRGDAETGDRSSSKPRGNKRLLILVAIAAVLAIAVGVGGFVWPGFFVDSGPQKSSTPNKKFVPKISNGTGGETAEGGLPEGGGKSIKQIMSRIDRGPQALGKAITSELNKDMPAWDELAPKTKELAELAGSLGALKPGKGDTDSWATHSAAFAKSASELDQSVQSKDRD